MIARAWSLRRRLTLAVVAVVALVLLGLAAVLFGAVERAAWRQHDDGLRQRAHAWSALVEHDEEGYEMELPPPAAGARATYVEVRCGGALLARVGASYPRAGRDGTTDLPQPPVGTVRDAVLPDGRDGRVLTHAFVPRSEGDEPPAPCTLVLAEGVEGVTAAVGSARRWFVALAAVALLLATATTTWIIGRGLRPLTELGRQLDTIDRDTLATRIELRAPPRELAAPVARLNELLARLDDAFGRERRFTADVSHELRTPLAGLRTLLEVTELTAQSTDAYRRATTQALAIVGELTRLVASLLALARADGGQRVAAPERVALRDVVEGAWRDHAATAASRDVRFAIHVGADVVVRTDRDLAAIVIGNLLANAAAYTEAGGWIEVRAPGGDAIVEVIDSGPPIPAEHLPRLFDRMWRADASRTAGSGHAGLGLALVRSLGAVLGWTVTAANRDDGAVVFRVDRR